MVVQFGELDFEDAPNRTSRYIVTARDALEPLGVDDPAATSSSPPTLTDPGPDLSTIVVKRDPVHRRRGGRASPRASPTSPSARPDPRPPAARDGRPRREPPGGRHRRGGRRDRRRATPSDIGVVTDDRPFFWHFSRVRRRARRPLRAGRRRRPRGRDRRAGAAPAARRSRSLYAAVFLLLPFARRPPNLGGAAGEGGDSASTSPPRARLHALRDHDDPAARPVPRLPDVLADGDARRDPASRPASARCSAAASPIARGACLRGRCSPSSPCSRSSTGSGSTRSPTRCSVRRARRAASSSPSLVLAPLGAVPRDVHAARPRSRRPALRATARSTSRGRGRSTASSR